MQVTIDSNEPLADVLRVVGSIYDVTLTAADGSPKTSKRRGVKTTTSTPTPPTTSKGRRTRSARAAASSGATVVDPKLVRQWAWENGHEVNARGSLPTAVRDAYRAANRAESTTQ